MNADEPVPAQDLPALEALLAAVPWPDAAADDGLDEELLAAWAEGNLSDAEAGVVESRLAASAEGRTWMAAVRASLEPEVQAPTSVAPQARAPTTRRTAWIPLAAAALALIAVGVVFALGGFDRGGDDDSATTLTAALDGLRTTSPTLWDDFKLLTDEELAAPGREVERGGGLFALSPTHQIHAGNAGFGALNRVEDPGRRLRWRTGAGITEYTLRLFEAGGKQAWSGNATTAAGASESFTTLPAHVSLAPGMSYVWEVSGDDGFGEQTARATFRTLSGKEQLAVNRAFESLKDAPLQHRNMLLAHLALRAELYAQARSILQQELRSPTPHPQARRALDFIERR